MLNLLPQQEKKKLINEYKLRLSITILIFVCALLVVAIVGLFPTYLSKKADMEQLLKQKKQAESENTTGTIEEAEALKISNKALVDYIMTRIETLKTTPTQTSLITDIMGKRASAIVISGIEIEGNRILVRGVASTRSELIAFHSALRKESQFKNAILPIGDIAKSIDAQFTIDIILP